MDDIWPVRGLDLRRLTFQRGVVEAGAAPEHWLSMHVGEPVAVDCACDGVAYRGFQTQGRIDLTPAGAQGRWEDAAEARVILVSVAPSLLRDHAREMEVDADRIHLTPQFQICDPQLEHIIWALASAADQRPPTEPLIVECLTRALTSRLLSRYAAASVDRRPQQLSPRQRRRVLDYIEAELGDRITLAQIAEVAGVSASHFKALFRHSMGQSVHQYLIQRRVERAAALIKDGAAPMSEIAVTAGFSHQSHMARWMRRVKGITPSALARSGR